jgi:uncharacterized protein HemX
MDVAGDLVVRQAAIICAAGVVAIAILSLPFIGNTSSLDYLVWIVALGVIGLGLAMGFHYQITKRRTQVELTSGEQYRQLAEEYRRLTDMAITSQEHTDLKLGGVSAQLDHLREQVASLQKILEDVE